MRHVAFLYQTHPIWDNVQVDWIFFDYQNQGYLPLYHLLQPNSFQFERKVQVDWKLERVPGLINLDLRIGDNLRLASPSATILIPIWDKCPCWLETREGPRPEKILKTSWVSISILRTYIDVHWCYVSQSVGVLHFWHASCEGSKLPIIWIFEKRRIIENKDFRQCKISSYIFIKDLEN